MKNTDLKIQVKSSRKSAANDIEATLITALKKVAAKLGQNSKNFTKKIEKGSKQLAKKLSKEMEFAEQATSEVSTTNKAVNGSEKPQISPKSEEKPAAIANAAPADKKVPVKPSTASKPAVKDAKPV